MTLTHMLGGTLITLMIYKSYESIQEQSHGWLLFSYALFLCIYQ